MENFGEILSTTGLVVVVIIILISSLISALLHGLGFSIFGFNDAKPTYKKRYILQILSSVVYTLICFVASEQASHLNLYLILNLGGKSGAFAFYAFIALFISLLSHVSLSSVTYLVFDAKGKVDAALKSPLIITAIYFVICMVPAIMVLFS